MSLKTVPCFVKILACSKRSDSCERGELGKASEKTRGDCLNAWNRLSRSAKPVSWGRSKSETKEDLLSLFVFPVGKDRQLCSVELKQVMSRARQTHSTVPLTALVSQAVEKITNCHLFAVGQVGTLASKVLICL